MSVLKVDCLKSRLTGVTRDKYQTDATVSKLGEEIDRKVFAKFIITKFIIDYKCID